VKKRIGNGQGSSLWFDPWLEEGRIVELLGRDICVAAENLKVSHIIRNGHWHLSLPGLSPIWQHIQETDIHAHVVDS